MHRVDTESGEVISKVRNAPHSYIKVISMTFSLSATVKSSNITSILLFLCVAVPVASAALSHS